MANYTTGAERYNKRMDKIWEKWREIKRKEDLMSYKDLISEGYTKETAKHIIMERKLKKIAGF